MSVLSGLLAGLIIIAATFGGNAWAAGPRGSGQSEISGYTVSDVHFELSADRPTTETTAT